MREPEGFSETTILCLIDRSRKYAKHSAPSCKWAQRLPDQAQRMHLQPPAGAVGRVVNSPAKAGTHDPTWLPHASVTTAVGSKLHPDLVFDLKKLFTGEKQLLANTGTISILVPKYTNDGGPHVRKALCQNLELLRRPFGLGNYEQEVQSNFLEACTTAHISGGFLHDMWWAPVARR